MSGIEFITMLAPFHNLALLGVNSIFKILKAGSETEECYTVKRASRWYNSCSRRKYLLIITWNNISTSTTSSTSSWYNSSRSAALRSFSSTTTRQHYYTKNLLYVLLQELTYQKERNAIIGTIVFIIKIKQRDHIQ